MDFVGRNELITKCSSILDDLENGFLAYSKSLLKGYKYVDSFKFDELMELVFENITKIDYDKKALLDSIDECFDNKDFAKYLICASLLNLINEFNKKITTNYSNLMNCQYYFSHACFSFANFVFSSNLDSTAQEQADQNTQIYNQNYIQSSGFSLMGNVIDEIKALKSANFDLEFLNLYKGIKIKSKAQILDINENSDTVLFQTDLMQILAMKEEKNAFIVKNDHVSTNVKADILGVYLGSRSVLLGNFSRIGKMHALQRAHSRVHPSIPTSVILKNNSGIQIEGKLFDISQGGIGVVSIQDAKFEKGDELTAIFNLVMPDTKEEISVNLKVNLVTSLNYNNSMRYCCQSLESQDVIPKIVKFSKTRQAQLLEELQNKANF